MSFIETSKKVYQQMQESYAASLILKAKEIAKKFANNMTQAAKEIEKLSRGLSDHPEVEKALRKYNEEYIKEDGHNDVPSSKRMCQTIIEDSQLIVKELNKKSSEDKLDTWWTNKLAVSAHNMNAARDYIVNDIKEEVENLEENNNTKYRWGDINKAMMSVGFSAGMIMKVISALRGKEVNEQLEEAMMSPSMVATLKKEYEPMRGKTINAARARQLMNILDKLDDKNLEMLSKQNIPFVSSGSKSKLVVRKMKFKVSTVDPFKEDIEYTEETLDEACWKGYKQVGMKNKGGKQVPNCVPEENEEIEEGRIKDIFTANKEGESIEKIAKRLNISIDTVKKVLGEETKEHRRIFVESLSALKKKASETGMPYNILKQVYDRGMAAWKSGHRPGAGQVQWALARVNSFVTKSSGTWGGADKDLAAKVKGSK